MPPLESSRFSHLSAARQALVRLYQSTNYGYIEDLTVRDREPVLTSPGPVVLVDLKLDSDERSPGELAPADFVLCTELVRLMSLLDRIQNGKISKIEVRAGIARRILFDPRLTEAGID